MSELLHYMAQELCNHKSFELDVHEDNAAHGDFCAIY